MWRSSPTPGSSPTARCAKPAAPITTRPSWGWQLLADEDPGLEVLGDSAYGTAEARVALADAGHSAVIKPIPLRTVIEGGFTRDDFIVDEAAGTVDLPGRAHRGDHPIARMPTFGIRCRDCPLRARCTTAKAAEDSPCTSTTRCCSLPADKPKHRNSQTVYRQHRPMVERSIAWIVRGNRKLRYRGITKNDWWLHHRVAAINLRRLITLGLHHTGTNWAIA